MNEVSRHLQEVLFPSVSGIAVASIDADGEAIHIEARCTAAGAVCPVCGTSSEKVHSSYLRFPADLPSAGQHVVLALRVRRYVCTARPCPRRTFVEQVPGLTRRHGRVTERLRAAMGAIGLALAGRAGARLASLLGIATSRSTLLRRVMNLPDPAVKEPRAVGVDDFALRRGHVYGTVVIDAETHQVLDLLPERDAATLAPWLRAHPGIKVICRDRSGAYADAADTAAPQAVQVADRFHLWQNLTVAVEKTVAAHRSCLRDLPPPSQEPEPEWETPAEAAAGQGDEADSPTGKFAERARAHHALVHELLDQGVGLRHIARHLGGGRHTVQRYARAARWQDMVKGRKRQLPSKLDPFKPHLAQRWAETDGKVTILDLYQEITARGFRGHYSTVRDWARRGLPRPEGFTPAPPPPSVRQVTGWLTRHPATLTEEEKLHRKVVLDHCPELASAAELTGSFAEMLTTLSGTRLPDWITEATDANLPGISSFAVGLNSDFDAVTAGLTTHWNSGPVEGAVNRIKMLKRTDVRPRQIRSPAQASTPRFMTSVSGCWNAASASDQRYQEPNMGTWGTGPFDSDLAADFVDELEGLSSEQIIDVLHGALQHVADSGTRVDGGDGVEAVAAAALVAAQVPGSGIVIDPDDGPKEPLPQLPVSLRALARKALHRVTEDGSELTQGWVDSNDAIAWRQEVQLIRDALNTSD